MATEGIVMKQNVLRQNVLLSEELSFKKQK